jgi:hypothetical protein
MDLVDKYRPKEERPWAKKVIKAMGLKPLALYGLLSSYNPIIPQSKPVLLFEKYPSLSHKE